jgi:bifunctional non-homologous end joining protein LigD
VNGGGEGTRLWIDDLAGLLGLVEMGVIELHPWGATIEDIERPDTLVFDLDPGDGIEWPFVQDTALRLREMLERDEGLGTWPKLTGGKGIHIMVPIERDLSWDAAHDYCRRLAERFAIKDPKHYTTSAKMSDRPGRLFIDYLRNGRGTTAVGAYSPRARAGFPIAAPVTWRNIERGVQPNAFTVARLPPQQRRY